METRRTLRWDRDLAIDQRDAAIEQRDKALTDTEAAQSTAEQLAEARDEIDALRKAPPADPAPADWQAERRDLRRELMLVKRARAALVDQVEELRACNHALSREAMGRAGTLAKREVTTP